jgi:hypothetical protein
VESGGRVQQAPGAPPDAPTEGAGVSRKDAVVPASAPATYTAMKRSRPPTISRCGPIVCSAWLLIWGVGWGGVGWGGVGWGGVGWGGVGWNS